jgi:hypothetical protein
VLDNGYCLKHSPRPQDRLLSLEAEIAGGAALRRKLGKTSPQADPNAPTPTFRGVAEVLSHFETVAGDHRRGTITDGHAFAQCAAASKAWEVLSADRRLRMLERGPVVAGVEVVIEDGRIIVRGVVKRPAELPATADAEGGLSE